MRDGQALNPIVEWGPGLGDDNAHASAGSFLAPSYSTPAQALLHKDRSVTRFTTPGTEDGPFLYAGIDDHYFAALALNDPAQHYNPGGKLGNFTASDNVVVCVTCHAAHIPSAAGTNRLTVVSLGNPLAADELNNPLCVACHGPGPTPTGSSNANPGTTAYYHPVNAEAVSNGGSSPNWQYAVSTGTFNILVNTGGTPLPDLGAGNRIVCTSCHAPAHRGVAGTMILSSTRPTCASCHNLTTKNMGTTANSHHVYGGNTDYTARWCRR